MDEYLEGRSSKILTGITGEYFVAAELSCQGYIASITLRNTEGIDILASNLNASKTVAIQVKTNHWLRKKGKWVSNEKAENLIDNNLYYIFVHLNVNENGVVIRPDFHIVPSKTVADTVKKEHAEYLNNPGRNGQKRKDNSVRNFRINNDDYLEKWEKLGLR